MQFCSKKAFPTFFDTSLEGLETVTVSGGKPGTQVELAPADLLRLTGGSVAALVF